MQQLREEVISGKQKQGKKLARKASEEQDRFQSGIYRATSKTSQWH
jgi:hypothetical protein